MSDLHKEKAPKGFALFGSSELSGVLAFESLLHAGFDIILSFSDLKKGAVAGDLSLETTQCIIKLLIFLNYNLCHDLTSLQVAFKL